MLKLILLRHGKAANAADNQEDYERALNRKGIVQINQIGQILKDKTEKPGQIISSSAKRTAETTDITNYYLKVSNVQFDKNLYLATEAVILDFIKQNADEKHILYVGHNFGISNLASLLGSNSISMSTGMMAAFSFNVDSWAELKLGTGKLDFVYAPNIFIP